MSKTKKAQQLGMNPSTAQQRLVKDLLWEHVASHTPCHRCGGDMSRDTFSIEHLVPWLDSEDPVGLFFDLENVGFSHLACNVGASRVYRTSPEHKRKLATDWMRKNYDPEARRRKYERTGH